MTSSRPISKKNAIKTKRRIRLVSSGLGLHQTIDPLREVTIRARFRLQFERDREGSRTLPFLLERVGEIVKQLVPFLRRRRRRLRSFLEPFDCLGHQATIAEDAGQQRGGGK